MPPPRMPIPRSLQRPYPNKSRRYLYHQRAGYLNTELQVSTDDGHYNIVLYLLELRLRDVFRLIMESTCVISRYYFCSCF